MKGPERGAVSGELAAPNNISSLKAGVKQHMTKKQKLVWRLSKLPSPDEICDLVKDKIITQEEARQILFSSEEKEDRDKKSLESEIKFLRELVEKLSKDRSEIVKYIEYYEPRWRRYPWYEAYATWSTSVSDGDTLYLTSTSDSSITSAHSFSGISTF